MSREVMQMALDALEHADKDDFWREQRAAIAALRTALAEQPVPVGEVEALRKRSTGWVAPKDHYAVPVLFNPYTGEPRDVRDVQSDPQGILIAPPGKVEMLAARPGAM